MRKPLLLVIYMGLILGACMTACLGPIVMNAPFCAAPDSCADSSHVSRK